MVEDFLKIVAKLLNVNVSTLTLQSDRDALQQWDSLAHLRLIAQIEETYLVEFPIEKIMNIKSLNDIYQYIMDNKK